MARCQCVGADFTLGTPVLGLGWPGVSVLGLTLHFAFQCWTGWPGVSVLGLTLHLVLQCSDWLARCQCVVDDFTVGTPVPTLPDA